jgi:hypothetical protein
MYFRNVVTFELKLYRDKYSASHPRVDPENVGLRKEQNWNTFTFHTCNKMRLSVLWIRKKEVGDTKR